MSKSLAALTVALLAAVPLAAASHADGSYDIPVWFEWSKAKLDVWIVPPGHGQLANENGALGGADAREADPFANSYVRATLDSIASWDNAVDAYGPAWLRNGLDVNVYLMGRDVPPALPTADAPPEVVIVFDESKANILGVAFSSRPCIVDNSKLFVTSFTYEDMFNINAQEYGHCLGLNHVDGNHPTGDPMNGAYPYTPGAAGNPRNCVSNLDVKGLEGVFAQALGQPPALWGANGRLAQNAYGQVPC